ncbi:MAG: hypothetical protein JOY89_23130 [Solirubrobacterales bacterium]|nr:hypothetical protein [Solirubrobacterales bacterium]
MDADAAHSRWHVGVEHAQLTTGEIDVLAVERAKLADASPASVRVATTGR